ncbi:MAG TPA: nickel pincer cofactor biosynthesis protein LarC [Chloroflexota bacterium]|nr:nickel pincer cofactor biosynthesis protein LarC [Chloroflexota bacterium]
MKVIFVDCFSGVSGDMLLGALVDLGVDVDDLRGAVERLPVGGYRLAAEAITRQGLAGHAVHVTLDDRTQQPTRHLADVEQIIRGSDLSRVVQDRACGVFRALAEAEATVHGVPVDAVHFHEVGAVDAIVDVVGVVWGLRALGVEQVFASSLPTGLGTVQTAHGVLPVPAPATLALLAKRGAPLRPSPATTELVTPTGAALLATLATFEQPDLRLSRVGYGFGQKLLPWANVVRLWLGETAGREWETDTIDVVEANLDDERPEILGATMQSLLAAGALDVFFTPIQMKKDRPAVKLSVLSPVERTATLSALVLRETSTLGVRVYQARRVKCRRWQAQVPTPWGDVLVKVKEIGDERVAAPEYEDCLRLAKEAGVPLAEVYAVAKAAAKEGASPP